MKISILLSLVVVVVLGTASCTPNLAQRPVGVDEQEWRDYVKGMYPGWNQPKTLPPAVTLSSEKVPFELYVDHNDEPFASNSDDDFAQFRGIDGDVNQVENDVKIEIDEDFTNEESAKVEAPKEAETEYTDYVIVKDDTLSDLAKKFYGNGHKYFPIYQANKDIISDPNKLKPGMKIRIPKL